MAWIELHQTLKRHPKTWQLADELETSPQEATGYLVFLWTEALDFADDGDLTAIGPRGIARWAGWDGDPERFVDALARCRWIDRTEERIEIHDWWSIRHRHAATAREARIRRARRQGSHNATEWQEMADHYGRCLRCGSADKALTKDHVIPVSRGGSDAITNLQPLCKRCNSVKATAIIDYRVDAEDTLPEWLPEGEGVSR